MQSKASHHNFCGVPKQPKPRPPSLLLRGSNMFNTEHISRHWSVNSVNSACSLNASSHSYPWGIKWRNTVMRRIVQGLSRFSYQLYLEGIKTGKLQVQASKTNQECHVFLNSGTLAHFLCWYSLIVSVIKDCSNPATGVGPRWSLRLHLCLCSRSLGSHFLVQEVSPWHHSVFRDVNGTPQAWCRWDVSWDEMGSWCIRMGQCSPQAIFT